MTRLLVIFMFLVGFIEAKSQEKIETKQQNASFKVSVGVVDMKKILAQSSAYQSLVDAFEEKRRTHRYKFTKLEDVIRDEVSNLIKHKMFCQKKFMPQKLKS